MGISKCVLLCNAIWDWDVYKLTCYWINWSIPGTLSVIDSNSDKYSFH